MSGHTPGPWYLDEYEDVLALADNQAIVFGHGGQAAVMRSEDARLIATAPCLLKAAERYLQFMHHGNCGFGWQFSGVHPETELKNAIARAKGEA